MTLLILGIIVWSLIHFIPAAATGFRSNLIGRIGLVPYKGLFGLVAIGALIFIVYGWKAASAEALYLPPSWGPHLTILLMLFAFILFLAPYIPNSLSRFIRHPQLTGLLIFGMAHLFSNGEMRSAVLFGGLALWGILQIILLNRRDGVWIKPDPVPPTANIRLLLGGAGFFAMFLYSHGWLFGVGPLSYI